jgi:hypothetical protein
MYIYDKTIHEPRTIDKHVISPNVTEKAFRARALFNYGLSLLQRFNTWDIENLPNPQYYDAQEDCYIEKANRAYLHAVNFVLIHELGHVTLGHIDKDIENNDNSIIISNETKIQEEIDADNFSFERIFQSPQNLTNDHTAAVGLISALCSFIFFSANMKGEEHPDPDMRLKTALEKLNLEPEDNLWGLSCLAFKLWSMNNNIDLEWPNEVETYKDLFYLTIEQLDKIKNTIA